MSFQDKLHENEALRKEWKEVSHADRVNAQELLKNIIAHNTETRPGEDLSCTKQIDFKSKHLNKFIGIETLLGLHNIIKDPQLFDAIDIILHAYSSTKESPVYEIKNGFYVRFNGSSINLLELQADLQGQIGIGTSCLEKQKSG